MARNGGKNGAVGRKAHHKRVKSTPNLWALHPTHRSEINRRADWKIFRCNWPPDLVSRDPDHAQAPARHAILSKNRGPLFSRRGELSGTARYWLAGFDPIAFAAL
jgi:hypothetical protein